MAGIKILNTGRKPYQIGQEIVVVAVNIAAAQVDTVPAALFTAMPGKRYAVVSWGLRYVTASTTASARINLERVPSGTAAGSGTSLGLAATDGIDVNAGAVNTNLFDTGPNISGTVIDNREGSSGANILEGGESLFLKRTNAANVTALANATVWVVLQELPGIKGS